MKKLTIGELKKFIAENHLPDDMFVYTGADWRNMDAHNVAIEEEEVNIPGIEEPKKQNVLVIW